MMRDERTNRLGVDEAGSKTFTVTETTRRKSERQFKNDAEAERNTLPLEDLISDQRKAGKDEIIEQRPPKSSTVKEGRNL